MLNELHPHRRYKENGRKIQKKCLMHFDPDASVFVVDIR